MPVADILIVRDGGDAAPFNEKLPQGAKLSPVTVNAVFDGSGAAGSFIPAVVLLNPSGVVIARAADPANVVAAGASAEVSWFQGVKNAAAGGLLIGYAGMWQRSTDPPQTINAGATFDLSYATGNLGPGGFVNLDIFNGVLSLLKLDAIYMLSVAVRWSAADFPRAVFFRIPVGTGGGFLPQFTDKHDYQPASTFTAHNPSGLGELWSRDTAFVHPSSNGVPPIDITVRAQNGDAVDHDVVEAYLAAYIVGS